MKDKRRTCRNCRATFFGDWPWCRDCSNAHLWGAFIAGVLVGIAKALGWL